MSMGKKKGKLDGSADDEQQNMSFEYDHSLSTHHIIMSLKY